MTEFSYLFLDGLPILDQLRLEEALLRSDPGNWCLINTNAPPSIVMGISGKPEKLLNLSLVSKDSIPVIKRFSGGGTVYIDPHTVFVTFICNSQDTGIPAQPYPVLYWSEKLYQPFFPNFRLRENDYVFGERKFGGNAQYLQKNRWLLHTSFLWDFALDKMEYLLMPERRPAYRGTRAHGEFLCSLKSLFPNKEQLISKLKAYFQQRFSMKEKSGAEIKTIMARPYRKSTEAIALWGPDRLLA